MTGFKVTSFTSRLNELVEKSGQSLSQIANELGVSKQAISAWQTGTRTPKSPTIETIARYFSVDIAWLNGYDVPQRALPQSDSIFERFSNILPIQKFRLPILGTINCGEPSYADEDFEGYAECGTGIKADFVLRCKGDSMIGARIYDGDLVFIRKQPDVLDGEIAAVILDEEATLKRVRYLPGGMIMLQAENPRYAPIVIGGDNEVRNVRILGKAVAFQANVV